jgi:hypothetical protein
MSSATRDGSTTIRLLRQSKQWFSAAAERATTTAQTLVSGSFISRWLTAEPDPEVIVIDLRETWTVGPIIALVDRLLAVFTESTQTSRVAEATHTVITAFRERPIRVVSLAVVAGSVSVLFVGGITRSLSIVSTTLTTLLAIVALYGVGSDRTLENLQETKAVQLLISVFEPPEPPSDRRSERTDSNHETDDDVDSADTDR